MTQQRVLIGGGVLLVLVLAVLDAVLIWSVLIGRSREAAHEAASEPIEATKTYPCNFKEDEPYCVTDEGDVYLTELKDAGPGTRRCIHGADWGYCPGENGKIPPGDKLPVDVCGNGTFYTPCYPHPAERKAPS